MHSSGGPFHDRTVLITGGTSGIGRSCFELLSRLGARCVAIGKPTNSAESQDDDQTIFANLLEADAVESAFKAALERLGGRLDILIHTVGGSARSHGDGSMVDCSPAGFQAALKLNLETAFLTLQAAVRQMRVQNPDAHGQRGIIALAGSVLADRPSVGHFNTVGYVVAKAGLEGLVLNAAAAHAADGIRINMLKPGLVSTPMAERALNHPQIMAFLRHKQPLTGGPLTPESCAQAILGLVNPEAVGMTGSILTLDGGWSISDGY